MSFVTPLVPPIVSNINIYGSNLPFLKFNNHSFATFGFKYTMNSLL